MLSPPTVERHRAPREWRLRPEVATAVEHADLIRQLGVETGLSPLVLRVCVARGLRDAAAIEAFLNPRLDQLTHPSRIQDLDLAVARLARAREQGEKVLVFGDYDVDGTSGAALLSWVFRDFALNFTATQPDRFKDGYGLNVAAVEQAAAQGVRVLVTVDCGITSFAALETARELGLDAIIVDHHQLDATRGLPQAYAVINPQRPDCPSQLKQVCGCGLAFYLAMGLRTEWRRRGWFAPGQEPNLRQHLDLVVLATAADMVPLTGDNHILVRHGMDVMKQSRKPGLKALLDASGLGSRDVSPGHLGFVLGPRINASGRMQNAALALELLSTTDGPRAQTLAQSLEALNAERAEVQNAIWDEVRARVEQGLRVGQFQHGIVVADESWHEGVVGIVASRVTETFRRPAAVIAIRDGHAKGSVRTYGGKDVLQALRASSRWLTGFGGHRHAAGLNLAPANLEAFTQSFDEALGQLPNDEDALPLWNDGPCEFEELDVRTLLELERLGPFGTGNPEPVFTLRVQVRRQQILKGRHLKMGLVPGVDGRARGARELEAIWFHAAERMEVLENLDRLTELAGIPELNRFRGAVTPTFRVRDGKLSAESI